MGLVSAATQLTWNIFCYRGTDPEVMKLNQPGVSRMRLDNDPLQPRVVSSTIINANPAISPKVAGV